MSTGKKMPARRNKHTFAKGHKRAGGKPKGSKNKKTLILESFAQDIVEGGMAKFRTELNKLKGEKYIRAYTTLFEYVKPKLARTEHTGKDGKPLQTPHTTVIFKNPNG